MAQIKKALKSLVPPIILSQLKKFNNIPQGMWSGDYVNWKIAKENCIGYDNDIILGKCKDSLLKVKNNEAKYERDSVIFDKKEYSWGLLAGILKAAISNNNKLSILDFGGSLGTTYFQNREFLNSLNSIDWCIVEQGKFVECGIDFFANKELKFYYSAEDCIKQCKPNVLLLSGVLQYLDSPHEWIEKLLIYNFEYIIIDRTSFIDRPEDLLTIQNIPNEIYNASYPAWFFNEHNFLRHFKNYNIIGDFESFCDNKQVINSKYNAHWHGYLLTRK